MKNIFRPRRFVFIMLLTFIIWMLLPQIFSSLLINVKFSNRDFNFIIFGQKLLSIKQVIFASGLKNIQIEFSKIFIFLIFILLELIYFLNDIRFKK